MTVDNGDTLSYSVRYGERTIIDHSVLGFEFKDEAPMAGGFKVLNAEIAEARGQWIPVVKSKRAVEPNHYNALTLKLAEPSDQRRRLDLEIRVYDEGVAFRLKLYRGGQVDDRKITKELTTFSIPDNPTAWIVE